MADADDRAGEGEPTSDGSPKRDLRYSSHEDRTVRVDRELDASGRLARGDRTKMSVLNFSSRHPVRTERDPEFAFRPAPPPPAAAPAPEPPSAEAPVAAERVSEAAAGPDSPGPADQAPSVMDRVKQLFGF